MSKDILASLFSAGMNLLQPLTSAGAATRGLSHEFKEEVMAEERGGSGNFANDPQRASEAGKKGGEHNHGKQQQQHQSGSSKQQGGGNFADDRERASEA
jgi:hypothetical protein